VVLWQSVCVAAGDDRAGAFFAPEAVYRKITQKERCYMKTKKILPVLFFLAVLMALPMGGCVKKDASAVGGTKKLVKFPVQWGPTSINGVLIAIGLEEGYFEQGGLELVPEPLTGSGNVEYITAAITGKLKLSLSAGSTAPLVFLEEHPEANFLMIGGVMGDQGALLIPKGKEAEWEGFTPEKMAGKRIGVRRANSQDTAFRGFLARSGIDLSTVNIVELDNHPSSIEGTVKGELDGAVVVGIYRTVGVERGLTLYQHIDDLFGHFICCRAIGATADIKANRDLYVNYFYGIIKAYKIYATDPEKTLTIGLKHLEFDEKTLKSQLYELGHFDIHPDPASDRIRDFYQAMIDIGYCKGPVETVNAFIDISIYRDALDKVLAENSGDPFFLEMDNFYREVNTGIPTKEL
jgi:NitT/TauT family transport system substrate-binding protein